MGLGDKISAKAEETKGKLKEAVGSATGDARTEAEGKLDQASGKGKEFVEDVKSSFD